MSSFLNYLNDFEQKLSKKPEVQPVETPKPVAQLTKPITENKVQPKKVVKLIKKPVVITKQPEKLQVSETINKAANILEGINECSFTSGTPSSARFYDNTSPSAKQKNINTKLKDVANRANSILGESEDNSGISLTMPLMNVPKIDDEMLNYVPIELLNEHEKQKLKMESIRKKNQTIEMSPDMQIFSEETKKLQTMFGNVDMTSIPEEFRPRN
jgi:hypothetical protein